MDKLQFVYPWSSAFTAAIAILSLTILFLLGLYLFYRSTKLQSGKWKIVMSLSSFFLLALPTKNLIVYQYKQRLTFNKYVGKYLSTEKIYELNLLANSTWTSRGLSFRCNTGKWELVITEDGTWIKLCCTNNSAYNYEQLWPANSSTISIRVNGKAGNRIKLEKYESNIP